MIAHPKVRLRALRNGVGGDRRTGPVDTRHATPGRTLLPHPPRHQLTWLGVLGELILIATVAGLALLAVLS